MVNTDSFFHELEICWILTQFTGRHTCTTAEDTDWCWSLRFKCYHCRAGCRRSVSHSGCCSISSQCCDFRLRRVGSHSRWYIYGDTRNYLHAPKGFSQQGIPLRLYSHSWQDLQDTDGILGPVENLSGFTLWTQTCFGFSDSTKHVEDWPGLGLPRLVD